MASDLSHLTMEHHQFDRKHYLEFPLLHYDFIKLPRINFKHSVAVPIDTRQLSKGFIETFTDFMGYIYPIFVKDNCTEDDIDCQRRWTSIFKINSFYIQDYGDNVRCVYFIINNNDTAETFIQAFCELYKFVNVQATFETLEEWNKDLSDYIDLPYIESKLNELGIEQTENILERIKERSV